MHKHIPLILFAFGAAIAGCNESNRSRKELEMPLESKPEALSTRVLPKDADAKLEVATLGGGCFWCIEAVFQKLKGVEKVESGYMGGKTPNPTYRDICTGRTGHAEIVQVTFNPKVLSYSDLLDVFFAIHDPTTLNRQGPDAGTQYRSVIFFHSPEQKQTAEDRILALAAEDIFDSPIVTEVVPAKEYFKAEDYHQNYFQSNPGNPYCQVNVSPKLAKLRQKFADRMK